MPVPILTTDRLRLRPRVAADIEANLAMDLDPGVQRFIATLRGRDPAAHRAELEARIAERWPRTGGLWAVEWADRPGFLGWCALFPLETRGMIELGYRYVPAAWGRGVASEAGRAVLAHGFATLDLPEIAGFTHPDNHASRRVLAKLGFTHEGIARHYGLDGAFFRLTRTGYEATIAVGK